MLDLSRMPGPRGRWGSGNLADILQPHFHRVMSQWAAKYGEVYKVQVLGLNGVVVACPETIQRLFGRGDDDIPKHVGSYWHLDILWSEGRTHSIFTDLATDSWRAVRRAVAPCFSTAAVRCAAAQRHCTVLAGRSRTRARRLSFSKCTGCSGCCAVQADLPAGEAKGGRPDCVAEEAGTHSSS